MESRWHRPQTAAHRDDGCVSPVRLTGCQAAESLVGRRRNSTAPLAGDKQTYDDLPVLVVSEASDVRNFRVMPGTVAVTVSGPPNAMAILQADQIHAVVNLTGIESSHGSRWPVEVSVPIGMTLIRVNPPEVGVIVPPPPSNKNQ